MLIKTMKCVLIISDISSTFSRLSKRIIFIIKNHELCITNVNSVVGSANTPTAWSQIHKDDFFSNFIMNGVDNQYDEIWLSLHPGKNIILHGMNTIILIESIYIFLQNS